MVHAEDTRHATTSQDENPFTSLRHNDDNDFVDTRDDDPVNSFRDRPRYTVDSHGENPFTSSRYNTVSIDDEYFHETIRKTSTPVVSARNVRPNSFKTADLHDEELSAAPLQIGYRTERAYTNNTKWSTAEPSRENDDIATKAFESREVPHNDAAVLETPPVLRSGPDLVGATPEDLSAERGAVCDAGEPADIPDKAPVKRGGLLPPVLGSTPREGGELIEDYEKIGENGISERQEEKSHEFVRDNEAPKQEEEAELRKEKSDASLEDLKTGDDKGFIGDCQVGGVKELSYNTELDKEDEGRLSAVARSEGIREADDGERSAQAEENVSSVQPQGKHVDPCSISDNVDYPTVLPENMQEHMIKQDSSDTNVDKDSEGGAKALHTEPGSEDVVEKAPEKLAHGETDGARIAEVVEESSEQRLQDAVIPNAVCANNEDHQQKEVHVPTEPKGKTYDIDALFESVAQQPLDGKQYAIPNAVCEDNEKHQQKEIHGPTEPKGKAYDIDALFASVAQQPLDKEQQVDGEGVPASQPYPLEGSAAEPKVAELDVANEGEDNQIGGTDGVDLLYSDAVDPGESQENLEAGMLGKEGRVLSWSSVGSKDNSVEQEIPGDASTANDANSTVRQAHATSGTSGEKADQWWQWDNVTHPEDPKPKTQWEGMIENNEKNSKISNGSEAEAKIYTSVEKHDGSTEEDVSSREVAESTLAASSEDAMAKNRLNANRPRPSVIISPLPVPTPREGGEGEEDIL
ncbi:unnamed protein product [Trypanosoma congolense IL3000]|uniref:WGS project CAEQ00000000 data, annotated contig 896 n=1 Tax=Trypanosoma congolense (strain IL3000) TaxID=1068625 RepID=F9WJC6_TRYCI|nr:unnamed protein product [Trypanosoma congolense IL3000]